MPLLILFHIWIKTVCLSPPNLLLWFNTCKPCPFACSKDKDINSWHINIINIHTYTYKHTQTQATQWEKTGAGRMQWASLSYVNSLNMVLDWEMRNTKKVMSLLKTACHRTGLKFSWNPQLNHKGRKNMKTFPFSGCRICSKYFAKLQCWSL